MSSGLSFSLHLLALLSSVLISFSEQVFTHIGKKISSSSKLLFLPAQQLQWGKSFYFPIIPYKVLKLALIGPAFFMPICGPITLAWEALYVTWTMLTSGLEMWLAASKPPRLISEGLFSKENLSAPTETKRNDVGQAKQELPIISLWLNHCWILAISICHDLCSILPDLAE